MIVILDGSLHGSHGNTRPLINALANHLKPHTPVKIVELRNGMPDTAWLNEADGFVFATGTYWDSWGSPLQRFLEEFTHLEGTSAWMGKPAAVLVTMHSVGGKEVLSRLQGVLSTLGLLIPPMSAIAYSQAAHIAIESARTDADFWNIEDLAVISHNLLAARGLTDKWRTWLVEKTDFAAKWLK